jgi:aconitate hydratase
LVVVYALIGRVDVDLLNDPVGYDPNGLPVYLKDIWPTPEEIATTVRECVHQKDFKEVYDVIFDGDEAWQKLQAPTGLDFQWDQDSTYIQEAPFFKDISERPAQICNIEKARVLLYLGDSVTTDHISPAGSFRQQSSAGQYLESKQVAVKDFNSYGSRRGNHEVMMRGTFANVRIKNRIATKEGGFTTYLPNGQEMSVFEASMRYQEDQTPLIILAGKEYGSGSSRDWAAKGANLLGVKAVIAESFERIHRSNLVGMGIVPLEFPNGQNATSLGLKGTEVFDITGLMNDLVPHKKVTVRATKQDGSVVEFEAKARFDSAIEIEYYRHGGILHYVLRSFLNETA